MYKFLRWIAILSILLFSIRLGILEGFATSEEMAYEEETYPRGKILKILDEVIEETDFSGGVIRSEVQMLEVLILEGIHQGKKTKAEYNLSVGLSGDHQLERLKVGDRVMLYVEEDVDGGIQNAYVAEILRERFLLYLVLTFVLLLLVVGRGKGLKAIIALIITAFAIIKILIPGILKGWNPVLVSVLVGVGVIAVTLLLIGGFSRKTTSAIIGTTGGVIVAGLISFVIATLAKLTGFGNEESRMLLYIPQQILFDFRGLLFASIIIGSLGATMDVGVSIASAIHEIKENTPKIKKTDLMKAGMNVGKDIMGTMANTLILAYAGGSLHLMLLLMAHERTFSQIINWDMIASEVLRAMAGSIGIIVVVPLTAFVSAFLEGN
jgi:uncharacterized membrane protein